MASSIYLTISGTDDKALWPLRAKLKEEEARRPNPLYFGVPTFSLGGYPVGVPSKAALYKRFRQIWNANEKGGVCTTSTIVDLPEDVKPPPPGSVLTAVLTTVENPSSFFLILDAGENYCLNHPEWTKHFLLFRSGVEALVDLTKLLGLYFQVVPHPLEMLESFQPSRGDLVCVRKIESYKNGEGKEVFVCQMRRGLVLAVIMKEKEPPLYSVYMLDFGGGMVVSKNGLLPLPKPFNFITPLAIKSALFGVSPVGEKWSWPDAKFFQKAVEQRRELVFSVEVMSEMMAPLSFSYPSKMLLVSLDARKLLKNEDNPKEAPLVLEVNFGEELVKSEKGLAWNLFPARPKLMKGEESMKLDLVPSVLDGPPQLKLSKREGVLMTPHYPRSCNPLPLAVERREVEKLFWLRRRNLVDVFGADNRLILRIPEKNPRVPVGFDISCVITNRPHLSGMMPVKKKKVAKVEKVSRGKGG